MFCVVKGPKQNKHLFVSCRFTIQIWTRISNQLERNGQSWRSWDQHIEWTIAHAKGKSQKAILFRIVFAEVIHAVWIERNLRIVKKKIEIGRNFQRNCICL